MKFLVLFALCIFLTGVPAIGSTISFDRTQPGVVFRPLSFPDVAISSSSGGALFVYGSRDFGMPAGGAVCGLQTEFSCTGNVSLLFVGPVSNLRFSGFDATKSDKATIAAYAGDVLVSYLLVLGGSGEISVDLTDVSGITRLEIEDRSSPISRGIAYGGFTFDLGSPRPPVTVPPPPRVLSFDAFDSGVNPGVLDLVDAILRETSGGRIFVYESGDFDMPVHGGFCAFDTDSFCRGDFSLEFKRPVFDLMFSSFFALITDSVIVSLFDGDLLVWTAQYYGNSEETILFDFRSLGKLTRLDIVDVSDASTKGMAFGNFQYRLYEQPPAPVPIAPSLFLLSTALTCLGLERAGTRLRRRSVKRNMIGPTAAHA